MGDDITETAPPAPVVVPVTIVTPPPVEAPAPEVPVQEQIDSALEQEARFTAHEERMDNLSERITALEIAAIEEELEEEEPPVEEEEEPQRPASEDEEPKNEHGFYQPWGKE